MRGSNNSYLIQIIALFDRYLTQITPLFDQIMRYLGQIMRFKSAFESSFIYIGLHCSAPLARPLAPAGSRSFHAQDTYACDTPQESHRPLLLAAHPLPNPSHVAIIPDDFKCYMLLVRVATCRQYRYNKEHYYYGYISTSTTVPLLLQYR